MLRYTVSSYKVDRNSPVYHERLEFMRIASKILFMPLNWNITFWSEKLWPVAWKCLFFYQWYIRGEILKNELLKSLKKCLYFLSQGPFHQKNVFPRWKKKTCEQKITFHLSSRNLIIQLGWHITMELSESKALVWYRNHIWLVRGTTDVSMFIM